MPPTAPITSLTHYPASYTSSGSLPTTAAGLYADSTNRSAIDDYIASIAGKYNSDQVNSLADQLANNKAGVSYQELQSRLAANVAPPSGTPLPTGTAGATGAPSNSFYGSLAGQIDTQLGLLPQQQQIGTDNINKTYDSALGTLTNQQAADQLQYNTTRNNTQQDNVVAKNNIDNGVRTQLTGIQRLLGSVGAGNSSAANVLAPYAAGALGNQQRGAEQTAYGRNINALDTGWDQTQNQYNNAIGQTNADKQNALNQLLSGIDSTKSQLLNQKNQYLAYSGQPIDPAASAQVNNLANQVTQLGAQQVYNAPKVSYATPTLADYNVDQAPAPSLSGPNPNLTQNLGAYYTLLGGAQQKDKNGNPILQPAAA